MLVRFFTERQLLIFYMISTMNNSRIFKTPFASIYPLYIQKAEKKRRSKAEVNAVIYWLTGYDDQTLQQQIEKQ